MSLLQQEKPFQPPFPITPLWSENFCLTAHDPKHGIGIFLHQARHRSRLDMWREIAIIALPDGSVIAHRSLGNARASADGPGGGNQKFTIVEPRRHLVYNFDGGAHRVPAEELGNGLLRNGRIEPLQFELSFNSEEPLWDLHKVGKQQRFLGSGHIEQMGRVRGDIRIGGDTFVVDTMGNRDHSMGTRDFSDLKRHHWIWAIFDNGLRFFSFDAHLTNRPAFTEAVVSDGKNLYEARLTIDWHIERVEDRTQPVKLTLEYEGGTLNVETTRIYNTMYTSFTAPTDLYIGVHPTSKKPSMVLEQSGMFLLNGSIGGYGHVERTVPGECFIEKD